MPKSSNKKIVKAWARICLNGCGFIEATKHKPDLNPKDTIAVKCEIHYSLPLTIKKK